MSWKSESNRHSFASRGVNTRKTINSGPIKYPITDDLSVLGYGGVSGYYKPATKHDLILDMFKEKKDVFKQNPLHHYSYYYYIKAFPEDKEMKSALLLYIIENYNPDMLEYDRDYRIRLQLLLEEIFDGDKAWEDIYRELIGKNPNELNILRQNNRELIEELSKTHKVEFPIYPLLWTLYKLFQPESWSGLADWYLSLLLEHKSEDNIWNHIEDIHDGLKPDDRAKILATELIMWRDLSNSDMKVIPSIITREAIETMKNPYPDNPKNLYELLSKSRDYIINSIDEVFSSALFNIDRLNLRVFNNTRPTMLDILLLTDDKLYSRYRTIAEAIPLFITNASSIEEYIKNINSISNRPLNKHINPVITLIKKSPIDYTDIEFRILESIRREAKRILQSPDIDDPKKAIAEFLEKNRNKYERTDFKYKIYDAYLSDVKSSMILDYESGNPSKSEMRALCDQSGDNILVKVWRYTENVYKKRVMSMVENKVMTPFVVNKNMSDFKSEEEQQKYISAKLREAKTLSEYIEVFKKYRTPKVKIPKRDMELLDRMVEIIDNLDLKNEDYNKQFRLMGKHIISSVFTFENTYGFNTAVRPEFYTMMLALYNIETNKHKKKQKPSTKRNRGRKK